MLKNGKHYTKTETLFDYQNLLSYTHVIDGPAKGNDEETRLQLRRKFYAIKQDQYESIDAFRSRFDALNAALLSTGADALDDLFLADLYIESLNDRYREARSTIRSKVAARPTDVNAMHTFMCGYQVFTAIDQRNKSQATMLDKVQVMRAREEEDVKRVLVLTALVAFVEVSIISVTIVRKTKRRL